MSAILRLTEETIVLDKGHLVYRDATPSAVDYYMSSGLAQIGERLWSPEEVSESSKPFQPLAMRLINMHGQVVDTIRSTEPATVEIEYRLHAPISGLRIGIYLTTARGEYVMASFDTDSAQLFEEHRVRPPGQYVSRCLIPGDFLNEGRYILGINASAYRIRRYFQEEQSLAFTVDATDAPGAHWPELRMGPVRPRLNWQIELPNTTPGHSLGEMSHNGGKTSRPSEGYGQ
jgi:lipopolysaccharide transport system ATP-binding protein